MISARGAGPQKGLARSALLAAASFLTLGVATLSGAQAAEGFLGSIHNDTTMSTTVPANGDQNPYAIVVAPVSSGAIEKDDVLVTNFNNDKNLQGLGTTIVDFNPSTKKLSVFAELPRHLPQCPGGIGLTTAMTMLKTGWVIVGSAPSEDGTTKTKGAGCLLVLDSHGKIADVIAGPNINAPWGNMATIDNGRTATLFVSNAGFDLGAPTSDAPVVKLSTVLRLELAVPEGKPPVVKSLTVIGSGFGAQADKDVFLIGPTGLQLGKDDTLYVSDAIGNRINAIRHASTRTTSAGIGRIVTQDGLLQRPLAMMTAPNGNLIVTNAQNGQVVEVDPATGKQLSAIWVDENKAQTPPGSGDLFGIALTPSGSGFYYVEDEFEHAGAGAMSGPGAKSVGASRRGFLAGAAGLALAAASSVADADQEAARSKRPAIEPFWGAHQAGIATPQQAFTYFAALDVAAKGPGEVADLMRAWTAAAARLTRGETARPIGADLSLPATDSGEALDLGAARLTLTFGFGAGLFVKDGKDRFGWASARPAALVDLPRFNGDQLQPDHTGGDLSIQACADDPQVAFHAVRQLVRLAYGAATLRWTQAGFAPSAGDNTPRNLMGFKDGTQQPNDLESVVWIGQEGPDWMQGGSYLVVRKIRIALEHWDRTPVDFQEQTIGRHKYSGAPLGGKAEFDPLDLAAPDANGKPAIPQNAHVRMAAPASNDGAQILRRAFSYNDGANFTAERWPPWRQGLEYDAGLFFVSYQRDPRTGFIKIFDRMSKLDMLNQFTTHIGSGVFACSGGVAEGEFIGERLFRTA